MESYFENTGKPDVRAWAEMQYRIGMKRTWIWISIYTVLGTVCLYNHIRGNGSFFSPLILYAYAVYLLVMPYYRTSKGLKKQAEFYGGELPENTARFGEIIQIGNAMESKSWEYAHLVGVYSWKYSYGLRFADDMVLVMDRSNFTKGTFEEFKEFLRQKRPDLEIPD